MSNGDKAPRSETPRTDALEADPAIQKRDVPVRVFRAMAQLERELAVAMRERNDALAAQLARPSLATPGPGGLPATLRERATYMWGNHPTFTGSLLNQAANEIERLNDRIDQVEADRQSHEQAAHEADLRTQAAVRAEKEARAIADRQMNDAEAARIEIDILKADRDYPRHSAALSPRVPPDLTAYRNHSLEEAATIAEGIWIAANTDAGSRVAEAIAKAIRDLKLIIPAGPSTVGASSAVSHIEPKEPK